MIFKIEFGELHVHVHVHNESAAVLEQLADLNAQIQKTNTDLKSAFDNANNLGEIHK